jgi:RNA polymerase sigma-70 factor (ECF subfamily)
VLDPEVVLRSDGGTARPGFVNVVHGSEAVASRALTFRRFAETSRRALVNGVPGVVSWTPGGEPLAVGGFTVRGGRIVSIDVLADPDRLRELDLTILAD